MRKIMSIISILVGIVILHSCVQEDEEPTMPVSKEGFKKITKEGKHSADSVHQVQFNQIEVDETSVLEGDPPPKNQGQWRIKN